MLQGAISLHRQGRLLEAEGLYTAILKARPFHFDALNLLGVLKLQTARPAEAYTLFNAALRVAPQSVDASTNLGLALRGLGRHNDALAAFDRVLALAPDHIEARNNRGLALIDLGRLEEALACFAHLLGQVPHHTPARLNHANTAAQLGQLEAAIATYDAVLANEPHHAGALFNRGNALNALGREADAISSFDAALSINPNRADIWKSRGVALHALGRHQEAIASYEKAIGLANDDADARYDQALALLTIGDFSRGLAQYEWRLRRPAMAHHRRALGQPRWAGNYPITGKRILVHAEQGLGDMIQFVRYVRLLARAGTRVVLEVQPELKRLLSTMEGVDEVVARGEPLPAFDVHCPVASLPQAFGTHLATIPPDIPYLSARGPRLDHFQSRLVRLGRPRVAIAWAGSTGHANDRRRSIPLRHLEPLFALKEGTFLSVQRDRRDGDKEVLARHPNLLDLGDELSDFEDTAAVFALCDLIVTVDTSVAHLAGAMGRPVWILLPFTPDWRWLLGRDDSPWYPTAKLFRQLRLDDWEGLIPRLQDELGAFVRQFAGGNRSSRPRDER